VLSTNFNGWNNDCIRTFFISWDIRSTSRFQKIIRKTCSVENAHTSLEPRGMKQAFSGFS
jgi:hypothetical protein